MLKAGTNLASKSAEELIDIDAKTFELNGNNVRVAQVNTVDIAEVLERQAEIEAAIEKAIADNGYSDFVLMITDIITQTQKFWLSEATWIRLKQPSTLFLKTTMLSLQALFLVKSKWCLN